MMKHRIATRGRVQRIAAALPAVAFSLFYFHAAHASPAPVTATSATVTVSGTSPVTMQFPLTRSGDNAYAAWIRYATRNDTALEGADYMAANGTVKVPPGATGVSIPVQVLGASTNSPDKQFTLDFLSAVGVGPAPTFGGQQSFSTGSQPEAITMADVNGDGKPDLIVANSGNGTVSVYLNTTAPGASTASFANPHTFATGAKPTSVTVADVNSDGKPDLIVANYGSNTVSVLLNTTVTGSSTASFATQQTFAVGVNPRSVTTTDVNGDGRPDIIVTNQGGQNISVLLNTATPGASSPSFSAQQTFATGSGPISVAAVDVNGDGRPDLIVANYYSNTLSVLMNTTAPGASTPSFTNQKSFSSGTSPTSVTAADINGNGKPDLIVANSGNSTVSLLLNTTTAGATSASFAAQQTFATGTNPYSVTAVDVSGDGRPDIIAANYTSNTISVLENTTAAGASTASFAAQNSLSAGNQPESVMVANVNGDGKPDLIVANSGSSTVSVLLNTTAAPTAIAPSLAAQQTFGTGNYPFSVATADVNGDGKPDLIVGNEASKSISVLLNTTAPGATSPSFAVQQTFATGTDPDSVKMADINGDGKPDALVVNTANNDVSVLLNTTVPGSTTPSFATQKTFPVGTTPYALAVADVNGDGKPDLIVANYGNNTVSVLLNTTPYGASTPSFSVQKTFPVGTGPYSVTVKDVNGDGRPDLIVGNYTSKTVSVLMNTTTPGASTPNFAAQQTFGVASNPTSVAAADMNGDGKPDLIVTDRFSKEVSVLLNQVTSGATSLSSSSFAPQQTFAVGSYPYSVKATDINGDGKPDLIVANLSSNTVSVLLNTTVPGAMTTSFTLQKTFATARGPELVTTADLNGDGSPDVITANKNSSDVSVLLNTQYAAAVYPAGVTGTIHYAIPKVSLSPNPLGFGSVAAGASSTEAETLSNTGRASLTISDITIGGTNAARFAQSNNCPASLSVGASCSIQVTYAPNALSTNSATLTVSSNSPSSPDTVTLSGTGADTAPTAAPGNITTAAGAAANGMLSASDPDLGQTLAYSVVTQPAHGTVTITDAATGAFTYTPASGYVGSDSFTFKVNDGYKDSNTAAVSVTVADAAPDAIGASFKTATGQSFSGQLKGNANDAGQALTFALGQAPAHGSVTVNANGNFKYTPKTGYAGSDAFTFIVNDGYLNSTPATVSITVNDGVPSATNSTVSTPINTAYSGQLQASNPDSGQTLTYAIVAKPTHGKVSINAGTGAFTYTPASGYLGSDSFTFKVNDGYRGSDIATVSATVTDVAPMAQKASYTVVANKKLSGQLQGTAASSSQTLTYSVVKQPLHGTLSVNAASGTFTYIPDHDYVGKDDFTFKANDGTLDSNTATVSLTVKQGALVTHSGGGGSFSAWGLVALAGLLALVILLRRRPLRLHHGGTAALAAAALATLLAFSPARAAGAWYVGLTGNVINPARGRNASTAGFKGWSLRIGRHFGKHFALEFARTYYSDNPRTLTATAAWTKYGLRALYFPWHANGAFAPFAFAGIGYQYEYRGDGSEPASNSGSLGIGLNSRPWAAPVAIRTSLELQHAFVGGFSDGIASLGILIPFGAGGQ